jgi:NAD-dependent SIR2 family protein deacetylase
LGAGEKNTIEEYQSIKKIIAAKNNDNLAIFIGAGISKTSETATLKLPEWKDIIKDLKKEIKEKDENDFLKIAQWYYNAVGKDVYYKKISGYFLSNIVPSRVHEQVFNINPHIIITTNWDTILENAIQKRGYVFDIISNDGELVNSTLQHKLIKMHGDFSHHNIVFKEDDYLGVFK